MVRRQGVLTSGTISPLRAMIEDVVICASSWRSTKHCTRKGPTQDPGIFEHAHVAPIAASPSISILAVTNAVMEQGPAEGEKYCSHENRRQFRGRGRGNDRRGTAGATGGVRGFQREHAGD